MNKTITAWANDPIPSPLQNVFLCLFPADVFKRNVSTQLHDNYSPGKNF